MHNIKYNTWPVEHRVFVYDAFVKRTWRGPFALPNFQRMIFPFGGILNRVFTLTTPVRWTIWRKPSVRKFVRSIISCWPASRTIFKKRLENSSKKTVVILPISFLKQDHPVWHVLSFNFVKINVNLLKNNWVLFILKMLGSCGWPCISFRKINTTKQVFVKYVTQRTLKRPRKKKLRKFFLTRIFTHVRT